MKISRLFLTEAGLHNQPTQPKKKKNHPFSPKMRAGNVQHPSEPEDDDDWDEDAETDAAFGDSDVDPDYFDPTPEDGEGDPRHYSQPEKSAAPASPFASKSAAPSAALQRGKGGGNIKADKRTLEALESALESVRTRDEDLQDWVDDCIREIGRAIRSGSDLMLPKFEGTPALDDFNDDDGGTDEED